MKQFTEPNYNHDEKILEWWYENIVDHDLKKFDVKIKKKINPNKD